jgi:hypothetical protein
MADKAGYEPIPDVEKGEDGVPEKENYADLNLNDKQTKLLLDLDSTIASANLDLSIPKVDPSQLASDGQSFNMGLVPPTLTALCTFLAALYLEETAKAENAEKKLARFLVQYFPYVAAIAMFISSVSPIQGRLVAAIEPILAKMDFGKDEVEKAVAKIGPEVDSTIVALQVQVNEVLKPMKPTLKKAKTHSEKIKKLDASLDIPDVAEIDKEMDEAQGLVGARIKEAQKHLQFDQYIPGPFKSAHAFYWRVVFPIVLLVLAIQLAFAAFSQHCSSVEASSNPSRALSLDEVKDSVSEDFGELRDTVVESVEQYEDRFSTSVDDSKSLVMSVVWSYVITFLQLGAVFLLTNNRLRAWLTNKIMGKVEDETMRTLHEYGASSSFSDVLGTRMGSVRKKVLKVLKLHKKIESLLDRADTADKVSVANKDKKKGAGDKDKGRLGLLGRIRNVGKKK